MRNCVLLSLIIGSLCIGCVANTNFSATAEALLTSPPPTPDFIAYAIGMFESDNCIEVVQTKIWEPGNSPEELENHLSETMEIYVDGKRVSSDEAIKLFIRIPGYIVDPNSTELRILGRTEGPILVCLDRVDYEKGSHLATIRVFSMSGKVFEYSWAFTH